MFMQAALISLCVALGIGLLVGAERERRKDTSPDRGSAGIRTFAIASLLGAVATLVGGIALLAVAVALIGVASIVAYLGNRREDPGLTTEFALVLICALGGLAVKDPLLAAGIGVLVAVLLVSRNAAHHFVRDLLTQQDLQDTILFASIVLIALPLVPDQFMGPFHAINPRGLVMLVVAVMAISAAGYVGTRWIGLRYGLPLAGFAAGFVSSTATIHSMGQKVKANKLVLGPAVAGAVLSSVATVLQMSLLIGLVAPSLLLAMALPLILGGLASSLYGLYFLMRVGPDPLSPPPEATQGRAFDLKNAVAFALLLGLVMTVSAWLNHWLGERGLVLGALVAGLADAHAMAASAASLMASGSIQADQAALPIFLGLTANAVTKAVVAFNAGGADYARKIIPGLVIMLLAVWIGHWITLLRFTY